MKLRHIHASPGEYIAVHRDGSGGSGGDFEGDMTGCLIVAIIGFAVLSDYHDLDVHFLRNSADCSRMAHLEIPRSDLEVSCRIVPPDCQRDPFSPAVFPAEEKPSAAGIPENPPETDSRFRLRKNHSALESHCLVNKAL